MKHKIFVDGSEGTTGLKINEYLNNRDDIELLIIEKDKRKDPKERSLFLNQADVAILCLPDFASREAVSLITNDTTKVIDASTAFRTDDSFVYGIPELNNEQRHKIKHSKRVCVPGCHATGFALLLHPLIREGILPHDYPITCHSITGYSGGGKKLIASYENNEIENINSPKQYALQLNHKHLPEMHKASGLKYKPIFIPVVSNYYKGLSLSIPLYSRLLNKTMTPESLTDFYMSYYNQEPFIKVLPANENEASLENFYNIEKCNDTNRVDLSVYGNDHEICLKSRIDNLGKGASGAAIQCLNIMLGTDENTGLTVYK
jgi:N-acetyl-gamma-glutamyl-phosphate reductase